MAAIGRPGSAPFSDQLSKRGFWDDRIHDLADPSVRPSQGSVGEAKEQAVFATDAL
jgi:hypothetical protein